MGMDVAVVPEGDEQVMLGGTRLDQLHLAALNRTRGALQSIARGKGQPGLDSCVSQTVTLRITDLAPAGGQRCSDQAEAVDAGGRIASVEAERGPDERTCSFGQLPGRRSHRGIGYWASRSLPGRNGSPRKLAALAKRAWQVARVRSHPSRRRNRSGTSSWKSRRSASVT